MVPIQYRPTGKNAKAISDSLEESIRGGGLQPGQLMPTVRALAAELEVAPGTVAAAYKMLRDRGFLDTHGRHGTQVTQRQQLTTRSSTAAVSAHVVDLAGGQPDPDLLPRLDSMVSLWGPTAGAPSVMVLPELKDLAREKLAADGVPAGPITVTAGGLDAVQRVLAVRLRPGDLVAVEDPGWPNLLDLVAAGGLRAFPLELDAEGPRPESLRSALAAGARAVLVTNRAQNPTGVWLTTGRADDLRAVLAGYPEVLTVEDDHAAELARVELASVAGATTAWAFIRSTSKPYGPDLRVAVLTGDEITIDRVETRMRIGSGWVSTLLQRLVVAFWTSPATTTDVAAAADAYDLRRRRLIEELAARGVDATGETGLNVWVPVADELGTVTALAQANWAVAPGARFRQKSSPGIRITVSGLSTTTIPVLAAAIAAAVGRRVPGPPAT